VVDVVEFVKRFGREPTHGATARGRVNLIGEHTDYNGGFVLPAQIPLATRVQLAPRPDREVHICSAALPADGVRHYTVGVERRGRGWLDYVQGVTATLGAAGFALGGFDATITSDLPVGAGLASSAALVIALLRALRADFGLALDDVQLAIAGQRAESEFVGARVGIMDQLVASIGVEGTACFIDTRGPLYRNVPLPPDAALAVIDSGLRHQHASGDYNARRSECEQAAALLGVAQLRDLNTADLPRLLALPEPLRRRARHVISENARVLEAVAAIEAGDLARLGALFDASHASQRDDYDVSLPAIDRLVTLARAQPGVYGARLTGGGWGGAVLVLARAGAARPAAERAVARLAGEGGPAATVLLPFG